VERSVQTVRTNENASQRSSSGPASVDQALPDAEPTTTAGPESSEQNERKEEITNYEMNSKRIATVSNGYSLTRMSIAVVVNRARLAAILGEGATEDQINGRIEEIRKMVTSAAGFSEPRGDVITVSSVEFVDGLDGVEIEEPGMLDAIGAHTGTLINAAAFIVVVFLVVWFGLKPMTAALTRPATPALASPTFDEVQRALTGPAPDMMLPDAAAPPSDLMGMGMGMGDTDMPVGNPIDDLRQKLRPNPQERLARMVDLNEERTAHILRKWTHDEVAA
jgi:flagellar M-ring protein FliF